jgi:glycosyltransferase involved in cell wall biosynthesis
VKFSIVTAEFNAAETIGDTLAPITRQQDVHFKSIVVDSGSRDHTMRRCRLLFLSVRHHQTDELAEASVAFDAPAMRVRPASS